jgi:hypothetical protein
VSSNVFKIENGVLALTLVGSGDDAAWQAPGGVGVDTVTIADYTASAATGEDLSCQVTSAALTASPNTTTDTTPATFCGPEVTTTSVGVTSYSLDATVLQDPTFDAVTAYLFEHDTREAYFYLGLNGDGNPPAAIGRARIVAGAFGGDARVTLTATLSLPVTRKPDMWVGNATTNRVITGAGSTAATGATAGTPGTWTPSGSTPPANAAGATSAGVTASPASAWTTGQYVQGSTAGTGGEMHWSGTAWATGKGP